MGDLVLGLAKSAVEGVLVKAKFVVEEEKLRHSVQRDLIFITEEFKMVHSVLNFSDERVKDNMVRTWLRQIRDLAYNVEDGIDFVVHVDKKTAWLWRMVPSCLAPALPLDEAVAEIKKLKARVEDVNQRNTRYSIMSESGSNSVLHQDAPGVVSFNMARDAARDQHSLDYLPDLITGQETNLQVISLWETGGDIGMSTSIIRDMYVNEEVINAFPRRAWVKATHSFDDDQFWQSIVTQFKENFSSDPMKKNDPVMYTEDNWNNFVQQVTEQRYLVIIEDVLTVEDVIRNFLQIDNWASSRIIVSTQQLEIASLCTGWPYQVSELRKLSANHSIWCFFRKGSQHEAGSERLEMARNWMDHFRLVGHDQLDGIFEYSDGHVEHDQLGGMQLDEGQKLQDNYGVMSVWGIPGVGKSTLVKSAYYKRMLYRSDSELPGYPYSWVNVPHPFDLTKFCRHLLFDYYSYEPQADQNVATRMKAWEDPIQECCSFLRKQGCIIVIDGLQSKEEWDSIKAALLTGNTEAIVIVITNEASVATHCAGSDTQVFNVKGLETDKALQLFRQETGDLDDQIPEEEGQLIVTKCGGLPKVIVGVGSYLSKYEHEWTEVLKSLRVNLMVELETNPRIDGLWDLFAWIHSYFDTCPDALKPCMLYVPVFPAEQSIRRRRLLRRWIAEGYCWDTNGSTAEENGEKFFSMLIDLSIIQQPTTATLWTRYDKAMVQFQINGFFREYIASRPTEDNLFFALEGCCSLNSRRAGQHLTIWSSWDRDRNVFESINFSRLRSLTVFGKWESFFISANMRRLRVLDLEDTSGLKDDDLKPIGMILPGLKFLSLRGCREIRCLPISLGCLRQLQTLDVTKTSIVALPPTINNLHKLQYIRASIAAESLNVAQGIGPVVKHPAVDDTVTSCLCKIRRRQAVCAHNGGVQVPAGIGNLTALHTLGVVNVSAADGEAILREIKELTQLHKLAVSGINRENIQDFCSAISAHGHMESLSVRLDKDNDLGCLDIILPPKNLQSLKLYGSVGMLPAVWIRKIINLKKLTVQMTVLTKEDINVLQDLPNLVTLRLIVDQFQDGKLSLIRDNDQESGLASNQKMGSVLVLEIACKSCLTVDFASKARLEVLKLHCCSVSPVRFSGLENLRDIKEILLKGSCQALECCSIGSVFYTKQELQRQLTSWRMKPVLKLE